MGLRTGLQSCTKQPELSAALSAPLQLGCSLKSGVAMAGRKRIRSKGYPLAEGPVAPGHVWSQRPRTGSASLLPVASRVLRHIPGDLLSLIFSVSWGHL